MSGFVPSARDPISPRRSRFSGDSLRRRKGLKAPYTRQAAEKIRPEGAAWSADHPGFGTLLFSRRAN
jgi:hypothetical protein